MTAHPFAQPIAHAFAEQAEAAHDLGSPLIAAICMLVAERGLPDSRTRQRIATWPNLTHSRAGAVPLRLCGGLHRLVLDGADDGLRTAFPPNALDRERLWAAMRAAIASHDAFIDGYLNSPPQTNEVARAALLLPAILALHDRHRLPIRLMELGASAGLNQNLDRFDYDYDGIRWGKTRSPVKITCAWQGDVPFPAPKGLNITERSACDVAPVPIAAERDRRRLTSYVWPDQPQRFERLDAAMDLALIHPPRIVAAPADAWLADQLAPLPESCHTLIFHTIVWQYLPGEARARAENAIRAAGRTAGKDRPLSWLRFEADGNGPGGGVFVTDWAGASYDGVTRLVGRGDFHGRWVAWQGF